MSFGFRAAAAADAAEVEAGFSAVPVLGRVGLDTAWAVDRAAASALMFGNGGGKGEMETLVTDAECAV